jgi:hypothetical protein
MFLPVNENYGLIFSVMTKNTTASSSPSTKRSVNWKARVARESAMQAWGDSVTYFVPVKGVAEMTEEIGYKAWQALCERKFGSHMNDLYPSTFTYRGIEAEGILVEWRGFCEP